MEFRRNKDIKMEQDSLLQHDYYLHWILNCWNDLERLKNIKID